MGNHSLRRVIPGGGDRTKNFSLHLPGKELHDNPPLHLLLMMLEFLLQRHQLFVVQSRSLSLLPELVQLAILEDGPPRRPSRLVGVLHALSGATSGAGEAILVNDAVKPFANLAGSTRNE